MPGSQVGAGIISREEPRPHVTGPAGVAGDRARGLRAAFTSGPVLLAAFAFAVMGDPFSSVAYAMETELRSLGGRLSLLIPTMIVVVGIIVLVAVNYHYLNASSPKAAGTPPRRPLLSPRAWRSLRLPP